MGCPRKASERTLPVELGLVRATPGRRLCFFSVERRVLPPIFLVSGTTSLFRLFATSCGELRIF